jgi:hypothetical protein
MHRTNSVQRYSQQTVATSPAPQRIDVVLTELFETLELETSPSPDFQRPLQMDYATTAGVMSQA